MNLQSYGSCRNKIFEPLSTRYLNDYRQKMIKKDIVVETLFTVGMV